MVAERAAVMVVASVEAMEVAMAVAMVAEALVAEVKEVVVKAPAAWVEAEAAAMEVAVPAAPMVVAAPAAADSGVVMEVVTEVVMVAEELVKVAAVVKAPVTEAAGNRLHIRHVLLVGRINSRAAARGGAPLATAQPGGTQPSHRGAVSDRFRRRR